MSRIKIHNFGPIKIGNKGNDGWVEIKKVTLFIGNQGSGKSTIAKLISTFSWIEKALVRGDIDEKWLCKKNRFKNTFLQYHRLENYIGNNINQSPYIEYEGEAYNIKYLDQMIKVIKKTNKSYSLPQIMYVPAERNFLSYVKSPKDLKLSSDSLLEFLTEFNLSKENIKEPINLPINNTTLHYDKLNDNLNIKGNDYRTRLSSASSGFHSIVPLYIVSKYLSDNIDNKNENNEQMSAEESRRFKERFEEIWKTPNLSDAQKRIMISSLSSEFTKSSFINIVEEPEQNLFPNSQWSILKSLLEFNNKTEKNKLIITTHSPYILNFLTIAMQSDRVKGKIKEQKDLEKLLEIIPINSCINSSDVMIYQMDEIDGSLSELPFSYGIPSDYNYLNNSLRKGNDLFDKLLDLEEEL